MGRARKNLVGVLAQVDNEKPDQTNVDEDVTPEEKVKAKKAKRHLRRREIKMDKRKAKKTSVGTDAKMVDAPFDQIMAEEANPVQSCV